jgi:hypothetical protein
MVFATAEAAQLSRTGAVQAPAFLDWDGRTLWPGTRHGGPATGSALLLEGGLTL